jgi:pimeloyl-ACP methyl ester carboxylesterase
MESRTAPRDGITLRDHVEAVVAAIDDADGPVLLVGHSAGSGIAHAAVDARPDRVARAVYVGGFPTPDGRPLVGGLLAENGEVAMPDWREIGEEANVVDFDEDLRSWVEAGEEGVSELARIREVEYVDLPGGHWPQLTQPERLAELIVRAAEQAG